MKKKLIGYFQRRWRDRFGTYHMRVNGILNPCSLNRREVLDRIGEAPDNYHIDVYRDGTHYFSRSPLRDLSGTIQSLPPLPKDLMHFFWRPE